MGCATVARLRRAEKCIRERSSVEAAVGGTQRPPERVGAQHQRRGHGCGDNQRVIKGAYMVAHGKQALPRGAPLQQCRQLVAALHLPVARWVSCAVRFVGSATRAVCEALAQGLHTAACPYKLARRPTTTGERSERRWARRSHASVVLSAVIHSRDATPSTANRGGRRISSNSDDSTQRDAASAAPRRPSSAATACEPCARGRTRKALTRAVPCCRASVARAVVCKLGFGGVHVLGAHRKQRSLQRR